VKRCNRDGLICGSVVAVCELEWVQGFWDDCVDVRHDQPCVRLTENFLQSLLLGIPGFSPMLASMLGFGYLYIPEKTYLCQKYYTAFCVLSLEMP
jgi:hypothetical protein